ncbi:MAG TPA: Rieske (2Fe-2S) protein [Kofleriaceae bacterium]|nr:Rieske (2Fe-2S) protein [Kofleriaceae bacterium]
MKSSCSRRTVLRGIGVVAALRVLPSCTSPGSDLAHAKSTSCGGDGFCIDTTDPANKVLASAGGAMLVGIPTGDTVMVIRSSDTEVVALSAICTHQQCSMNFDADQQLIVCPCHGSQFDEEGNVVNGPAEEPIRVYSASLMSDTIRVITS